SPVLNALLSSIGFENGPLTVPSIPSGRNGRARKIKQRPVIATEPSSLRPSALAASAYFTYGLFARNIPPCALRSIEFADGLLANVAERAFCTLMSKLEIGASVVLTAPSTTPF